MTRTHYGLIAGIASAAVAAAWFWNRRDSVAQGMSEAGAEHGEVIFSNAPQVSES